MSKAQAQHRQVRGGGRKPYPTDVADDEWAFVAPYLTLLREDAEQRDHSLREVFNGLRYVVRGGISWRMLPNDLPPWYTVYQQTQRWLAAGVFETMVQDLRRLCHVDREAVASFPPHRRADCLCLRTRPRTTAIASRRR